MAKNRNKKKKKKDTARFRKNEEPALDPCMRFHLMQMRMSTVKAYFEWCREHKFRATLDKTYKVIQHEREIWRREMGCEALRRGRKARNPAAVLAKVSLGEMDIHEVALASLHVACERVKGADPSNDFRVGLAVLFEVVGQRTKFLLERRRFGARVYRYVDAIIGLQTRKSQWIRPLHAFRPKSHNMHRQFSELARHLFARYDVPRYFDAAWFRDDDVGESARDWFTHIGRGGNLRTAETPLPVTKRIAHHMSAAPSDTCLEGAFRYGQTMAWGGSEDLARAIMATPIAGDFEREEFWSSVIRFFAAQEGMHPSVVGPIVDYLRCQKFEPYERVEADGTIIVCPPPKPHLTMRGRTLKALSRDVVRWHKSLRASGEERTWAPCGIGEYEDCTGRVEHGNAVAWRIRELRSRWALVDEGKSQNHCVAWYSHGCERGHFSIWSMTREDSTTKKRVQTIQVNKHGTVVQSRGKNNEPPSEAVKQVIRKWTTAEGLSTGVIF